jgi:hypothetical protein
MADDSDKRQETSDQQELARMWMRALLAASAGALLVGILFNVSFG